MNGSYTLAAKGKDATTVTYRLAVDVKIPMLGMLKRKAEKVIIDTALQVAEEAGGGLSSSSPQAAGSDAVILFTGKGGVGKTTTAAATAVHAARAGVKTLVMSTDAAHSLGDALGVDLGARAAGRPWTSSPACPPSRSARPHLLGESVAGGPGLPARRPRHRRASTRWSPRS